MRISARTFLVETKIVKKEKKKKIKREKPQKRVKEKKKIKRNTRPVRERLLNIMDF